METHTNGTNSKALTKAIITSTPSVKPLKPTIERIFTLASEVVNLEGKLVDSMNELKDLVTRMDPADMPKLLIAMMKQPGISSSALATLPFPEPPTTVVSVPLKVKQEPTLQTELRERIMVLMNDGRERQAQVIIRALRAKKQSATIYLVLKNLVTDKKLVKPAYGFYRKFGV